jgi:hypothetical protein
MKIEIPEIRFPNHFDDFEKIITEILCLADSFCAEILVGVRLGEFHDQRGA